MFCCRALIVMVSLLPIAAAAAEQAADQAAARQVLDQADARRDAMLREMLKSPYPPDGLWHDEDFALAAYGLNQRVAEADRTLVAECEKELPLLAAGKDDSFHWHAYLLERLYFLYSAESRFFPGRMGREAEGAILKMLWQWAGAACRREMTLPARDFWVWGSENHHAQAWAGFWGAAEIFRRHPDYRDRRYADGSTPAEMAQACTEYFQRYAQHHAATGLLVECNSSYNKYTLGGWYNMADFSSDPLLRQRMKMLLDLYWADWAIEQLDGVRGGSRHRCYPGQTSTTGTSGEGLSWYHFGLGSPRSKHPSSMCAATSFYRPPLLVAELALDVAGRGEYEYRSRRPGLAETRPAGQTPPNFVADASHPFYVKQGVYGLNATGGALARYSWCTPDFILGTSMVEARAREDWTAISSQNRWEGAIFAGNATARIFFQPLRPARGSVYNAHWSVQNKGVLIVQRLKETNAKGERVWFDRSLQRTEHDGWVFAEAPRAYAAVRVVAGGTTWEPDTVAQHHEGKGFMDQGIWLKCQDEFSPVILEVARKSAGHDFAAFQAAILSNPLRWENHRLEYRSSQYGTVLTLDADYRHGPTVDGRPIDYQAKMVYDSPFLRSEFGSGVITITRGAEKLVLDFNQH
jgi:hypothetical protein